MSAPISEATRERLGEIIANVPASCAAMVMTRHTATDCECEVCLGAIVDAIVAALIAEGWRDMSEFFAVTRDFAAQRAAILGDVVADDEASAGTFAADQCRKCGHPLSVHHVYGLCAKCSR